MHASWYKFDIDLYIINLNINHKQKKKSAIKKCCVTHFLNIKNPRFHALIFYEKYEL